MFYNLHLYSQEALNEIVDTYLEVFKNTQLMTQVARDELVNYGRVNPTQYLNKNKKEYELLLYKDLKRCNYKAMLKQEDDNRNERIELKRTLEKIEIRLKLLEEKEREKKNSENKEQ